MDAVVKEEYGIGVGIDEKKVKIEEDDEYLHIIPYEYRDYKKKLTKEVNNRRRTNQCQKCFKTINFESISKAKYHAVTHTDLKRYKCPVGDCGYQSWLSNSVKKHTQTQHDIHMSFLKRRELTSDEENKLNEMLKECFPGLREQQVEENNNVPFGDHDYMGQAKKAAPQCQICAKKVPVLHGSSIRTHVFTHSDIQRYECSVPGCGFKHVHHQTVSGHIKAVHYRASLSYYVKTRKVTENEEKKLKILTNVCYPGLPDEMPVRPRKVVECREKKVDPVRIKCEDCDYITIDINDMAQHAYLDHRKFYATGTILKSDVNAVDPSLIGIDTDQKERFEYKCQICQKIVAEWNVYGRSERRQHALEHVDCTVYKCSEPHCEFKTKYEYAITEHVTRIHLKNLLGKELTTKQIIEMEVGRLFLRCFPK